MSESTSSKTAEQANKTVAKVIASVNLLLSKSSIVNNVVEKTASTVQNLLSSYVPAVLDYLPDKKVGKEFIFLVLVILFIGVLYLLGAERFMVDFTGIAYPVYASIVAIENKECKGDTQWLSYWMIFATMRLTDRLTYPILSLIPMFLLIKVMFLAWLYHPEFLGAQQLYKIAQSRIRKLILTIDPDFNKDNAAGLKEELSKRNSAPANKDAKASTSAAAAGGASLGPESDDALLVVTIKSVSMKTEKSIYVESTVMPNKGRAPSGIEDSCLKTQSILGQTCAFNEVLRFTPLPFVDGVLKIEVFEKPTFEAAVSLGMTEIRLLDLSLDAAKKEMSVELTSPSSTQVLWDPLTLVIDVKLCTSEIRAPIITPLNDFTSSSTHRKETPLEHQDSVESVEMIPDSQ